MMLLLMFFYIFAFDLNGLLFLRSNYLVGVILSLEYVFSRKKRHKLFDFYFDCSLFKYDLYLMLIIIYALIVSLINKSNDYSFIKTLFNQFLNLKIATILFYKYKTKYRFKTDLLSLISTSFLIQSFIQLISFLSPQINFYLNFLRDPNVIYRGQLGYGGIRGFSISGPSFFGLGIGYGLVLCLMLINKFKFSKSKIINLFLYFVFLFGSISSARFSLVGLIMGLFYLLVCQLKKIFKNPQDNRFQNLVRFLVRILISLFLVFLTLYAIYFIVSPQTQKLMRWMFQPVYNYIVKGEFGASSLSVLFNKMYFKIPAETLLFGDGIYHNLDGTYYMATDAGYMRMLLYFGVIGTIFMASYQYLFLEFLDNDKLKKLVLYCYLIIINIKGSSLGFSIMNQSILYLFLLEYLESKGKEIYEEK